MTFCVSPKYYIETNPFLSGNCARGRWKGRQIGRQEGPQESQRLVSRMMRHKFGVNAEVQQAEQKLPTLSVEQLEDMAEALLDFTESQDLTRWLADKLA